MSERARPANRRHCESFDFASMQTKFTASVGRSPDGRMAELFLTNCKAGSGISTLVRDLAIVFSFAVQHGADVESIRRALCRDEAGQALSPLGAALDLITEHDRD
jgi:hypothetical protein